MSKKKVRDAVRHLERLVDKLQKVDAPLAAEFGRLRSMILNIESNSDWRRHWDLCTDFARSQTELAEALGVSDKTVQNELRQRGFPPLKAGRKPAGLKYPFRISVPDSKPRKT